MRIGWPDMVEDLTYLDRTPQYALDTSPVSQLTPPQQHFLTAFPNQERVFFLDR